ncbi:MAG: threonylcarbamoyl-AMP synthase [Candidatus Sungbacteria bacterium]|nr:threonylcarbamoyl-AMP synthase [Candidatus Sungbacteria bacterium]
MRIIKLNESNQAIVIKNAIKIIQGGGIVIGPTDTVYGIFCDARNKDAIKKIFALKGRPRQKALPIFVRDIKMARYYTYISDAKARFLEKVWLTPLDNERSENIMGPGFVTVVFQHKDKLPRVLTGGLDTVGIRIPNHPFLRELLFILDYPVAQTSANVSDAPPARNVAEIKKYFIGAKTKPDLVIDAGEIEGEPSAVIDCTGVRPVILRTGTLSFDTLNDFWDSPTDGN